MFDLVTIVTPPLSNDKIDNIVWRCGLQTNSRNGVVFYDNIENKNLKQQNGIYVRIETNSRLKLEGSLHKYHNEITYGERSNVDLFSMSQAKKTIDRLLFDKGVHKDDAYIYNYEIGLNLYVSKDPLSYLGKMKSIGTIGKEKPIYVNPRYKDEKVKATVFHNHRKYFKAYDKVFECMDKKRKIIPSGNILRIETVYRRLDKCPVASFFDPVNLKKVMEVFFRDWNTLRFEQDIITPKGTGRAKQHLCMEIMDKGKEVVLERAKRRHVNGSLSDWEYRSIREFITREWDTIKKKISFIQSGEEMEFRELMKTNYTILKNDEIIKH